MTPLRCYNCGNLGHKTQFCPRFGPRYPEPGKTSQDYGDEAQRIANLFAADIVAEHEDHGEGDPVLSRKRRVSSGAPPSELELRYRQFPCEYCGAKVGDACTAKSTGQPVGSHSPRAKALSGSG